MTITLTPKAEQRVRQYLAAQPKQAADEAVSDLVLHALADADAALTFPAITEQQLEASLLEAVRGPHREWKTQDFEALKARIRNEASEV